MSYTYSLSPVYASQVYLIGYLIAFGLLWLAFLHWREWKNLRDGFPLAGPILAIAGAIVLYFSLYSHDTFVENPNTKIIGTIVNNYEATVRVNTGKHTYSDVPHSFVIYALPDGGQVSFQRVPGHSYPKNVYIYRNPSR